MALNQSEMTKNFLMETKLQNAADHAFDIAVDKILHDETFDGKIPEGVIYSKLVYQAQDIINHDISVDVYIDKSMVYKYIVVSDDGAKKEALVTSIALLSIASKENYFYDGSAYRNTYGYMEKIELIDDIKNNTGITFENNDGNGYVLRGIIRE